MLQQYITYYELFLTVNNVLRVFAQVKKPVIPHFQEIITFFKIPDPDSGNSQEFPKNLFGTGINSSRESLARVEIGNEPRVPDLIGIPIPTREWQPYSQRAKLALSLLQGSTYLTP